jgi:DNA-binding NarL/FixJ family response regulator
VLLREGIAKLLTEAGFEVVGQSATPDDLLLKVRSYSPDVAVVDVRMPPTQTDEGARAAAQIRDEFPAVGVLLLSQVVEAEHALRLFRERPDGFGYLLKDRVLEVQEFLAAADRVARGGSALDPEVVGQLVVPPGADGPLAELSEREREILKLMAEGLTNSGIARRLVVSERTIEAHVRHVLSKLDIPQSEDGHRRVLAVLAHLSAAR